MIKVFYNSCDGYRTTKRFKTLEGARRYAVKMVGASPEFGSFYAISGDGIGRVQVEGCTLAELFGQEG